MRVLRVTRILRLAGKQEGLQAIIETVKFSIPALMNVVGLLVLIFFMFSIMGCFLFNKVIEGDVIDDLKNFSSFFNGFLLLIAISTGEDWNKVMFDCSKQPEDGCIENINCGNKVAATLYYTLLILICSHVMLNLFILVIIEQFEKYYLPKENMISKFKKDLLDFMSVWKEFTQHKYRCKKIREKDLLEFFKRLGETGDKNTSLGFSSDFYDDEEMLKLLLKCAIKSNKGFVYFNEMLYRCMRRKYGNMLMNTKMQSFELRT